MDTCRGILDGDTHMGIRENVELREKLRRMHAVTPAKEYYMNHYYQHTIHSELLINNNRNN